MPQLQAHGLTVSAPSGWEARIYRRPQHGDVASTGAPEVPGAAAPPGEHTFPVVQVATIPLAPGVADFASDAVDHLGPSDAIVILKEYDPARAGDALFAPSGLPQPLDPDAFDPNTLQRRLPGQAGLQRFFNDQGRTFCLYVVLGGYANRRAVVPAVNAVLASIQIAPVGAPGSTPTPSSTTTTSPSPSSSTTTTTT